MECAVWPVLVVVAAVGAEDVLEVTPAEDEDPVEAVSADRAYPPLGMGVRVRGPSTGGERITNEAAMAAPRPRTRMRA